MNPNNPALKSFIDVAPDSHFPIQNLPYGVFIPKIGGQPRVGVAIGNQILDLSCLEKAGLLPLNQQETVFNRSQLNPFMALGVKVWKQTRNAISQLLRHDNPTLKDNMALRNMAFISMADVFMQIPVDITGYTDFYSSKEHATHVGSMFRSNVTPLLPNWQHLPVAYNGRASSVIVSDHDIKRPWGQIKPNHLDSPVFEATQKLDFELEVGFLIGKSSQLGHPISIESAEEYIFGLVLVNDWSARDIQQWEYAPLGPFTSKAFATSISPWIVTLDALELFKVQGPLQDPIPLPYLLSSFDKCNYNLNLEVHLKTAQNNSTILTKTNSKYLYWNIFQQLAHHTVTGCNVKVGDLMASGTISGLEPNSQGCLLELTWNGERPIHFNNEKRTFLENGDEVLMTGWAQGDGYRIGFGSLTNRVVP